MMMIVGLFQSEKLSPLFFPQSVVNGVTAEYNRGQLWLANESLVTQLQARVRGFLVRKRHTQRMEYLHQQEPHVVKLQVVCGTTINSNKQKRNFVCLKKADNTQMNYLLFKSDNVYLDILM